MMKRITIAFLGALAAFPQAQTPLTVFPSGGSAVGELRLRERRINGQDFTSLKAPQSLAVDVEYTLPSAYPTVSGQCLTSTTAGVWSWAGCGYTDYDVRSYGAVCDGVTDDTAAFASTIAAIGSNRGVVVLPPGVCLVTGITFTSSYQGMRGQGRDVSTLKSTTNSTIIDIPTVMTSAEFIAMDFSDFTIKGNGGTSQIGIRAIGTGLIDYATIHRITFDDVYKGVVIAPSIHSSYVHIQDNLFVGSFNCIDRNTPGTGWIITGNAATMASGGTCIYIHGSDGVGDIIVNSNHIEGGAVGIDFYCDATCTYGSRVVCNDNKIDTVSTAPIQAFNVTGSTFLGNRVIGGFAPVTFTGDNFDNIYDYDVSGIRFSDASSGHLTLHGGDFLIDGRGVGTQIHLSNTSTGGAYIFSSQDHQAWLMAGIEWDGTNFIPRATQASILRLSQGRMAFFGETGLTTGSPYVPALRWEIDSSNNWVPGATNSYSIGSTSMRPSVVYGRLGDFSVSDPSTYNAVVTQNTYVGAYGSCYAMSATDSVGSTVYVAGRICGRYTSNNFTSEEVTIQTTTGVGGYETAITIVNDDVTIDDTLAVGGNATLNGSINTMSGTLRPGFTGLGSIGDSSYRYGAGYFDAINTSAFTMATGAVNGYVLTSNGSGVASWATSACATCFVNGGNSFGAAANLGTNDSQILNIETNNTARIAIAASGQIDFLADFGMGSSQLVSDFLPNASATYSLGSTSLRWLKVWGNDADFDDDVNVNDVLTVGGNATLSGSINTMSGTLRPGFDGLGAIGDSSFRYGSIHSYTGNFAGDLTTRDILPATNNTYVIGNASNYYNMMRTESIRTHGGNIQPATTLIGSLGAGSARWNDIYGDDLNILTSITVNGNAGFTGTKTVRASGGAADCTLVYTYGVLTGGTC